MRSEMKEKSDLIHEPTKKKDLTKKTTNKNKTKPLEHKQSQHGQRPKLFRRLRDLNVLFLPKAERFKTIPLCVNPTLRGAVIVVWLLAQGPSCR